MEAPATTPFARLLSHTPFRRTLAPGGGFPSPSAVFSATGDFRQTILGLGLTGVVPTKSGKAALRRILETLPKRSDLTHVAVSAYTCPDLVSAIAAAGYKTVLFDIDPQTLLPLPATLPEGFEKRLAAVVLSNLFGLIDPLAAWAPFSGVPLIDDGCQAALGEVEGMMIGARAGCFGVLSFGRGKAFSGVGGGAAIGLATAGEPERFEGGGVGASDLIRGVLMWALEHPSLYGVPAALPFLGLGETNVYLEVPVGAPSAVQLRYAVIQMAERSRTAAVHRERMGWWRDAFAAAVKSGTVLLPELQREAASGESAVLLRYPILVQAAHRDRLWERLERFGASKAYPVVLNGYAEFSNEVTQGSIEGATAVAGRVLTLPLHRYVTREDVARVSEIMEKL